MEGATVTEFNEWNGSKGAAVPGGILAVALVFIAGAALFAGSLVSPKAESEKCARFADKAITVGSTELAISPDETTDPITWLAEGLAPEHECASSKVRIRAWDLDSTSIAAYAYGINSLAKNGGRCAWVDGSGVDHSAPCVSTQLSPRSEVHQMLVEKTRGQLPHPGRWDGSFTGELPFIVIKGLDCQKCEPPRAAPADE
jgi:hypothetical protein